MLRLEGVSPPDYFSECPKHAKQTPEFLLYVVLIGFQSKYEGIDNRWLVLQRYMSRGLHILNT